MSLKPQNKGKLNEGKFVQKGGEDLTFTAESSWYNDAKFYWWRRCGVVYHFTRSKALGLAGC